MARTKTKTTTRKPAKTGRGGRKNDAAPRELGPKVTRALRRAEEEIWGTGVAPHKLLQTLHEALLLRCLREADGNYAAAAAMFGPSRQSVQQYANSPLRDARWRPYQQNRRRKRED